MGEGRGGVEYWSEEMPPHGWEWDAKQRLVTLNDTKR